MAMIKVFSSKGVKKLECFDTLDNVPYLDPESEYEQDEFELNNLVAED